MVYPSLNLGAAGTVVALLLGVLYFWMFRGGESARNWWRAFPRSRRAAVILMTVDAIWAFLLVAFMDLGEFTPYRGIMLIAVVAAYVLTLKFVDEFLAVRALGIFLLLAAQPLLEAAFLKEPVSRILLVIVAYAMILKGLFWVGMPYLMRDQISWVTRTEGRWRFCCVSGLVFSAALLISHLLCLIQYR